MVARLPNQVGMRYERLTVVGDAERGTPRYVTAECGCGSGVKRYVLGNLRTGNTLSCGCLHDEVPRLRSTHGMSGTKLYSAWQGMRSRCTDSWQQKHPTYIGVRHCPEWGTFGGFLDNPPTEGEFGPGMVLGRRGPDIGDYTPTNARWITMAENTREASLRHFIDGESAVEVARRNGIGNKAMRSRLARGWSLVDAVTTPTGSRRKISETA